jgi:hypothetical protein
MALGRQFFGPILIATMWHLFTLLWIGVMSPYPKLSNMLVVAFLPLVLAWIATGWYGMWMGLRARHPVAAIWGTLGVVLLAPLIVIGGVFSLLAIFQIIPEYGFPGERNFESIACQIWAGYLILLILWTIHRVKSAFREAATDRFSDTQPIDWRPVWRVTWKFSTAAALVIAAIWGTRAYINSSGERAFAKILSAHPGFSLAPPPLPYIPDNQNLAQWDFLRPLNNPLPLGSMRYPLRPGQKMPIDQLVQFPRHPLGAKLIVFTPANTLSPKWGSGEHYSFPRDSFGFWETNYDNELIRLHTAARERQFLHFNVHLPTGNSTFAGVPPEQFYGCIVNLPRILAVRAAKRLEAGEHPLDDILLGLRFANSLTNNPGAFHVRQEMLFTIIQPIYDGIHEHRWNDSDLQQLQNAFAQIHPAEHFQLWREDVVREVANAFENPPANGPFGQSQLTIGQTPYYLGMNPVPPRLPGKVKAGQARMIQIGLGATNNLVYKFQRWQWEFGYDGMREDENAFRDHLIAIIGQSLNRELIRLGQTETAIDQVITACAIERFRLAENKLPTTPAELTPKYLHQIPNDFMTGAPLKYKLTQDNHGYRLYSVGANLSDDGGLPDTVELKNRQTHLIERDWVWIYEK